MRLHENLLRLKREIAASPERALSRHAVMVRLNWSATKARDVMSSLAHLSDSYVIVKGVIYDLTPADESAQHQQHRQEARV